MDNRDALSYNSVSAIAVFAALVTFALIALTYQVYGSPREHYEQNLPKGSAGAIR